MQRRLSEALLPWLVLGVLLALWVAFDSLLLGGLDQLIGGLPDWQISYWSMSGFVLSLRGGANAGSGARTMTVSCSIRRRTRSCCSMHAAACWT